MLRGLIKPDVDSKQPEQRIAALERLDASNEEHQALIERLALHDTDNQVSAHAIGMVVSVSTLDRLLATKHTEPASTLVRERVQALLEDTASTFDVAAANQGTEQMRVLVACHSSNEDARAKALSSIDSEKVLAHIVCSARAHVTRLAASERVLEPALLEHCISSVKNRDKLVSRQMQQRLTEHREVAEKGKLHEAAVRQIVNAMQTLSGAAWSPQYPGQFSALQNRAAALQPAMPVQDQALFREHEKVALQRVEKFREQRKQFGDTTALVERLQALKTRLGTDGLESLLATRKTSETEFREIKDAWKSHRKEDPAQLAAMPDDLKEQLSAFSKQFETVSKTVSRQLNCLSQLTENVASTKQMQKKKAPQSDLPKAQNEESSEPESPAGDESAAVGSTAVEKLDVSSESTADTESSPSSETVAPSADAIKKVLACAEFAVNETACKELRARLNDAEEQLVQKKDEQQAAIKAIHKQMGSLAAVIASGKWTTANSICQRVEKKINKIEGGSRKGLEAKLATHKKKLNELGDWKDFAAKPKLTELCESMEGLPARELKAALLAKEIKELQSQWKAIGNSRAANELWPRFKQAGDKAYEPCAIYFDNLAKQREAKQRNREQVCERLEKSLEDTDWESADWRSVEKTLSQAHREWRNNRIAGRKSNKAQEKKFETLLAAFDEKLSVQYADGLEERKDLIEKMKKLSEGDVNQHAINQAKRLQAGWKQCGPTRRSDDQTLWQEFNTLCSSIFDKRRADQKEQYKASMGHVDRAREIIKLIRQMSSNSADANENQYTELQDEFQGLAEFPEKVRKGLQRDYQKACDGFGRARESSARKTELQELAELRRLAGVCAQLEMLAEPARGDTAQESAGPADNREELEALFDGSEIDLPKTWQKRIGKRRHAACKALDDGTQPWSEETEQARRLHCIKIEILRDKETPSEDKSTRMQYQLEQLQAGPDNTSLQDTRERLRELEIDWLCMAPAPADKQATLESRFKAALE